MIDREQVIEGFEMSYRYSNVDDGNTLVPQQLVLDTLALLKAQEPVEPVIDKTTSFWTLWRCGACGTTLIATDRFCGKCGRAVKWE